MLRLLERIGGGCHGQVYRGHWAGKQVAVKVLHPSASIDEARALEDASLLRRLGATAFVDLLDVTVKDGQRVLVQEWIEGEDLQRATSERGTPDSLVVKGVLAQCAASLERAWNGRINSEPLRMLHRDLKPSNLLVARDGRARIVDMGLASRWTRPGYETGGTPAYAAPERFMGEESPAGDLYALGAVAYHLCTGRSLGMAGPDPASHARRLRAVGADLRARGVPRDLSAIVRSLLAWTPEDRPRHDELLALGAHQDALRRWCGPTGRNGAISPISWSCAEMLCLPV